MVSCSSIAEEFAGLNARFALTSESEDHEPPPAASVTPLVVEELVYRKYL